jgi:hypothetical protein
MTSLTPEAYAVIEGRHSDPFRYLGPHVENGSSVVRVFLPDAEGHPRCRPVRGSFAQWVATLPRRRACVYRKSDSVILVMKTAEDRP